MLIVVAGHGVDEEFAPLRHTGRVVPLSVDAVDAAAGCTFACPHHNIVARRIHGNVDIILVTAGGRIHQHVGPDFRAGGIVALSVNIVVIRPGFVITFPGHDERAIRSHGDMCMFLVVGRRLIDQKLAADRCAGSVIQAGIDIVITSPLIAFPGHHKGATGIHGDTGKPFIRCVGGDDKLAPLGGTRAVEPLPVNVAGALPDRHIVSAGIHRDTVRRVRITEGVGCLRAGGRRIDTGFASAGREAQEPDPIGLCVVIDHDVGFDGAGLQLEVPIAA